MKKSLLIFALIGIVATSCNTAQTVQTKERSFADRQALDSIVCPEQYKIVFSYDDYGNILSAIEHDWNLVTKVWRETKKYEATYNDNGNRTEAVFYDWDNATKDWTDKKVYIAGYDSDGNPTQIFEYSRWYDNYTGHGFAYVYDDNGKITEIIKYDWDRRINDWKEVDRQEYTYDNIEEAENEDETDNKIEYTYNDKKVLIKKIEYRSGGEKIETLYNDKGDQIRYASSYFDEDENKWVEWWKSECKYDDNGGRVESGGYSDGYFKRVYDNKGNLIENMEDGGGATLKSEYAYDDGGNIIRETEYEYDYDWDTGKGEWNVRWKNEYTFNCSYPQADLIVYANYGYDNMLTENIYCYDWSETDWAKNAVYTYHWSTKKIDTAAVEKPIPDMVSRWLRESDYNLNIPNKR